MPDIVKALAPPAERVQVPVLYCSAQHVKYTSVIRRVPVPEIVRAPALEMVKFLGFSGTPVAVSMMPSLPRVTVEIERLPLAACIKAPEVLLTEVEEMETEVATPAAQFDTMVPLLFTAPPGEFMVIARLEAKEMLELTLVEAPPEVLVVTEALLKVRVARLAPALAKVRF